MPTGTGLDTGDVWTGALRPLSQGDNRQRPHSPGPGCAPLSISFLISYGDERDTPVPEGDELLGGTGTQFIAIRP